MAPNLVYPKSAMEMVYGGMAGMLIGWIAGRLMKLSELGTITCLGMAGGGSILTGLPALWWSDIAVGKDGSMIYWGLIGAAGGFIGVAAFIFTLYLDKIVDLLKDNGML